MLYIRFPWWIAFFDLPCPFFLSIIISSIYSRILLIIMYSYVVFVLYTFLPFLFEIER
jgi:hypothetical protein